MASIQKRGKTYQYTVSHVVNKKSKPIRKGGFRTKKDAKLAAAEIELLLGIGPMAAEETVRSQTRLELVHREDARELIRLTM